MSALHNVSRLKDTIEKISFQLEFMEKENVIYEIDRDVILQYLREAYTQALQLLDEKQAAAIHETAPATKPEPVKYPVPEACIIHTPIAPEIIYHTQTSAAKEQAEPVKETADIARLAPIIASRSEQLQATIEPKEKQAKKKAAASLFEAPEVVAGLFDTNASVADNLARSQTQASVAQAMHGAPLNDLKKAIGINEKFLFINELFEGSMQAYTDNIEKLNAAADKLQANHILESLQIKYNWDSSHAAYLRMLELIQRRFAS